MKRRYLNGRYDVTGLDEAQVDVLAGEVTAMAEASDRGQGDDHPDVRVELDYETIEVCRVCGNEIPEGDDLCESCQAVTVVVSLSGADVLAVAGIPADLAVEIRQYHIDYRDDEASIGDIPGERYEVVWPA